MTASEIERVLDAHIFDKGLGQCRCGADLTRVVGNRMQQWRAHAAQAIAASIRLAATIDTPKGAR